MVPHEKRLIRTVGCVLSWVFSIFASGIAIAQVDCSPLDPRASISKEQEGKVNGAVDTLFKIAKAQGTLEGKLKEQIQNLQQGAPASDQLLIRLRMLYLFCGMVANAKDLPTERKIQLFQEMKLEALHETSSESKSTAEAKNVIATSQKPDVSGYWRDDDGMLYRIVAEKDGDYDMGRIEPPEDSGVYRNVRIDGREIEISIGVLPSGTQQAVANLKLSDDGNIMTGLMRSTQTDDLPMNWTLKRSE
jgi:hypothetical protein